MDSHQESLKTTQMSAINIIWASSRENLTLLHAYTKGADQPVHSHSMISAFVINPLNREHSDSVVECLTRDQEAAGSSLTGVTAVLSLSKTH